MHAFTFHGRQGKLRPVVPLWTCAIICAAVAIGCAARADDVSAPRQSSTQTAAAASKPTRKPLPDQLREGLQRIENSYDMEGQLVGPLGQQQRATVVTVFASWCAPCRHELAILGQLTETLPHVRILGINAFEDFADYSNETRLRAFLLEHAPWLQVIIADDELMAALGRPNKIPTMYVFDGNNQLIRAFLRSERTPPTKTELIQTLQQSSR